MQFQHGIKKIISFYYIFLTGKRDNVRKIGIVITDGDSKNKASTFYEAHKARESGITMVAIGVGDMNVEELKGIANGTDYLFTSKSYDTLTDLTQSLTNMACQGLYILKH